MEKFTDLLDDYLDERDRLISDYYDGRWIEEKSAAYRNLADLKEQMDNFLERLNNE